MRIASYIVLYLMSVLFGCLVILKVTGGEETKPAVYQDTVKVTKVVVDTIYHDSIIPVRKTVYDTIMVPVQDTVRINDTTYIYLPKERLVYEDSTFRAVVSGYQPSLDTLIVYDTVKEITKYSIKKEYQKWSVGPVIGIGYTNSGVSPYVGVGVSYNLLSLF